MNGAERQALRVLIDQKKRERIHQSLIAERSDKHAARGGICQTWEPQPQPPKPKEPKKRWSLVELAISRAQGVTQ